MGIKGKWFLVFDANLRFNTEIFKNLLCSQRIKYQLSILDANSHDMDYVLKVADIVWNSLKPEMLWEYFDQMGKITPVRIGLSNKQIVFESELDNTSKRTLEL